MASARIEIVLEDHESTQRLLAALSGQDSPDEEVEHDEVDYAADGLKSQDESPMESDGVAPWPRPSSYDNMFADAERELGVLTQLAGFASVCWKGGTNGVFLEEDASRAIDAAARRLHQLKMREPQLGYATNQQLLRELEVRIEMDRYNGGGGLNYRTVDSD